MLFKGITEKWNQDSYNFSGIPQISTANSTQEKGSYNPWTVAKPNESKTTKTKEVRESLIPNTTQHVDAVAPGLTLSPKGLPSEHLGGRQASWSMVPHKYLPPTPGKGSE